MENLTLKDLKLILTNYKKDNTPSSTTGLNKDDLIKLINKHNMLNTLNINDENDLVKLQKPKKEKKPRKEKPQLTKEEQDALEAEREEFRKYILRTQEERKKNKN